MSVEGKAHDNSGFESVTPDDDDTEIRQLTRVGSGVSLYSNIPARAVEKHGFEQGQSVMVKSVPEGILIVPFK